MSTRQVEDRVFPAARHESGAARLWMESPRKLAQKWYVQLSLFASSAHDRFLACEEAVRGNKNWSATISYYSTVHACRSLVFQCFGDFPRSHQEMGLFLAADERSWPPSDKIRFNWLSGFPRRRPRQRASMIIRSRAEWDAARRMLRQYYGETLQAPRVSDSFERFGPLFTDAKGLREDGNYEALLIAHEQDHFLVPRSLESLCQHLSDLARVTVDTARDALVAGLRCDPEIENDRPRILSLAHDFINGRLGPTIRAKLSGDTADSFQSWIGQIDLPNREEIVETIWEDVNYGLFEGKQALMDDYASRIEHFGERVNSITDSQRAQAVQPSDAEDGG